MEIFVEVCREGAKLPKRSYHGDAGADLFIPECLSVEERTIPAGKVIRIPLGLKIALPYAYMAINAPRSGHTVKGIISHIPPIDSGYRGEISAIVHNTTSEDYIVDKHERLCQMVIVPIVLADFSQVHNLENNTERGTGGFNSTGK